MSDLVEQYANERAKEAARESALQMLLNNIRSLMEKGGMALETAMDVLGVPESMAADVRLALGA